ncbi:MAG: hypothetical protein QM504_03495 [Pseudomonadota bacterium]
MKDIISQPLVYLQQDSVHCYVSFDLKIKGKKGTVTFNVPTEFKTIQELKDKYDTYLVDGNIRKMNLTHHAVANNPSPSPLLCYVFTLKHLIYYIKRNLSEKMTISQAIFESLVFVTKAYFPKHLICHEYNTKYKPFGRPLTCINIHNSNVGTIIMGNGVYTKIEVVGKYIDKYVCLETSGTNHLKNHYSAVLCKPEDIALNNSNSTIPLYSEHHLGN